MKITKYEHACVVVEEQGKKLVIDPGKFSISFKDFDNISAVVITHVHSDHFDEVTLKKITATNKDLKIFGPEQVVNDVKDLSISSVKAGQKISVGGFNLEFFGGKHELYEGFQNVAVMINDKIYHPGDSYTLPSKPIDLLCAPASAPWLRVTEASDFIIKAKAKTVIPIHNSLLSEIGESIHYRILSEAASSVGSNWVYLKPGQSLEI